MRGSCFDSNFPLRKAGWLRVGICYITARRCPPPPTAHQQLAGPFQQLPRRAPLKRADREQPNTLKQGQSFGPEPGPKHQAGHFYYSSRLWQKRIYSRAKQRHRFAIPTSSYSKMLCICTKQSRNKIMPEVFTKKISNE